MDGWREGGGEKKGRIQERMRAQRRGIKAGGRQRCREKETARHIKDTKDFHRKCP